MLETGENVAADFDIARADQDVFALRSQRRAATAIENGRLAEEIVPVEVAGPKGARGSVAQDEHPRPETTLANLAKLPTPFREGGTVTAGNASGVNDGAAALLIGSRRFAEKHGLAPLARITAMATAGVPPRIMGFGPAPASRKLLEGQGITIGDIDIVELNEAFAS